jgi:hypothetical protein
METPFFEHAWNKFKSIITSRKFLAAVGTTIGIASSDLDLEAKLSSISTVWVAYIVSVAVEDGLSNR